MRLDKGLSLYSCVFHSSRIAPDKALFADTRSAIDDCSGADMAMIVNSGVMLNQRLRIENAIVAHVGTGIDQSLMHNNRTCSDIGMRGNIRLWRDNNRQRVSMFKQLFEKLYSLVSGANLAKSDQRIGDLHDKSLQISICSNDRISEYGCSPALGLVDNSGDLETVLLLDDIDTGTAMAAAADEQNTFSCS